jgi:hypothetical protein
MLTRAVVLMAALVACCTAPSAGASTGNGLIAFARDQSLWTLDPSTGEERNLTPASETFAGGPIQWAPDGGYLLFQTFVEPVPGNRLGTAAVVKPDGSDLHPLVVAADRYWAPDCWLDRDAIVLEAYDGNTQKADLYLSDPSGTDVGLLAHEGQPSTLRVCSPAASRFFVTRLEDNLVHYFVPRDGGVLTRLPLNGGFIAPSPDGRWLAWLTAEGLYVATIDGADPALVAEGSTSGLPVWSPDSERIAFRHLVLRAVVRGEPLYDGAVVTVPRLGGVLQTLTDSTSGATPVEWSPDGTRIVFSRGDPDPGTFVMNTGGTCETRLLDRSAGFGDWQAVPGGSPSDPIVCADLVVSPQFPSAILGLRRPQTYDFDISNDGTVRAEEVRLSVASPPWVEVLALHPSAGSCDVATLSCELGSVDASTLVHVDVEVQSAFDGPGQSILGNLAVVASTRTHESNEGNDHGSMSVQAYACDVVGGNLADYLQGTADDDSICGLRGADRIFGLGRNDRLVGGPGPDFLDGGAGNDVVEGGGENDTVLATDGSPDRIDCGGGGEDRAVVDRVDRVVNCERIAHSPLLCRKVGTWNGDDLVGTPKRDIICGLPGGDKILGLAGSDSIDGGQGNDTLDGGEGSDRLIGGAGYDVILAQDGQVDTIDCGPDYDTVVADRVDRVAKNCENVVRGRR